ncbi:MAG TPA: hypothetical protein VKQ28_04275 [Candidatus Acidoferrum sp.]|nr:hypothetical protein [Candidatus Acidoferrum sp.]
MQVLVVWEPILASDWKAPSGSTLGRISDPRARQFWDPKHVVAGKLNEFAKRKASGTTPSCCFQKGFYWDDAILYAPDTSWNDEPASAFWGGPVVRIVPDLEKALNAPL